MTGPSPGPSFFEWSRPWANLSMSTRVSARIDVSQTSGARSRREEHSAVVTHTRSLRAPGWLDKPGALRSLVVCLDSTGPFIDVFFVIFVAFVPERDP